MTPLGPQSGLSGRGDGKGAASQSANLSGVLAPSPPAPSCPLAVTLGNGTLGSCESQSFYLHLLHALGAVWDGHD
jgi:hypothetical protein